MTNTTTTTTAGAVTTMTEMTNYSLRVLMFK
jgi:hypothetical protein